MPGFCVFTLHHNRVAGAICELARDVVLRRKLLIEPSLQEHLMNWVVDSMFTIGEDNSPF